MIDLVNFMMCKLVSGESLPKLPSAPHQLSSTQVWVSGLVSGPVGGLERWAGWTGSTTLEECLSVTGHGDRKAEGGSQS